MSPAHRRLAVAALFAAGLNLSPSLLPGAQTAGTQETRLPNGVVLWKSRRTRADRSAFFAFFADLAKVILPSRADLPFDRSIAFLAGVSRYEHLRPLLPFVRNDLHDLRSYLIDQGGFDEVYVAVDEVVSQQLLEDYMMNKFPAELGPKDRLLFYYSGHGADAGGTTGYLQFGGARAGDFARDVLAVSRVVEWGRVNRAAHMLFILDSCSSGLAFNSRSGAFGEADQRLIETLSGRGSRAVVAAGTSGEQTFEVGTASGGNGVFTRAFLAALEGGSLQQTTPAFLTLDQVVADLKVNVAQFASKFGKSLHPMMWTFDDDKYRGTFVFINPTVRRARVPVAQLSRLGVQRSPEGRLEGAMEAYTNSQGKNGVTARFPDGSGGCKANMYIQYPNGDSEICEWVCILPGGGLVTSGCRNSN